MPDIDIYLALTAFFWQGEREEEGGGRGKKKRIIGLVQLQAGKILPVKSVVDTVLQHLYTRIYVTRLWRNVWKTFLPIAHKLSNFPRAMRKIGQLTEESRLRAGKDPQTITSLTVRAAAATTTTTTFHFMIVTGLSRDHQTYGRNFGKCFFLIRFSGLLLSTKSISVDFPLSLRGHLLAKIPTLIHTWSMEKR